jgi:hypothetical protein
MMVWVIYGQETCKAEKKLIAFAKIGSISSFTWLSNIYFVARDSKMLKRCFYEAFFIVVSLQVKG